MTEAGHRITTAAENPLCARLQSKYSRRIAEACDPRRGEAVKRPVSQREAAVRKVAAPFSDTLEFVPATVKEHTAKRSAQAERTTRRASDVRSSDAAARRVAAYEKTTPFRTGTFSRAYSRAADIRARAYDGSEAAASKKREIDRRKASKPPVILSKQWIKETFKGSGRNDEIKVKSTPVSKGVIVTIILVAAVLLMILFSLSEINSFKNDISALEQERLELNDEIEQLKLDIDRKNDVRTIEQIATEEIGMVKSNQVESKYISLSDGDRVEIVGDENNKDADYGVFSTLLSTFGNNWETLRDYID